MDSLVPDQSQLTYDPIYDIFRDDVGNLYEYGAGGKLKAVATTNSSDPYNIKVGNYAAVLEEIAPGINTKINQTQTANESWIDTLTKLASAVVMTAQQTQLIQLNIERARAGLPPVDIAQYSGIGVNVGLSASTRNLLIYGGIALVAVLFLTRGR